MPMPSKSCIICGRGEGEVERLHYFPRNIEKSQAWLKAMDFTCASRSFRNYRICCLHFAKECYTDDKNFTLRLDAVPSLFSSKIEAQELTKQDDSISTPQKIPLRAVENVMQTVTCSVTPSAASTSTEFGPDPCSSKKADEFLTKQSRSRKPLFKNVDDHLRNATPREKTLIGIVKKKEKYITKLKKLCKKRGHTIKNILKLNINDSDVVNDIFKGMSSSTITFMLAQMRCAKRPSKGRRWTMEDKVLSLALYKRSPKCYALLRKLITLPSKRTLISLLEKVHFEVGINKPLFQHLSTCLDGSNESNRLCILMFDEISIREHIQYNKATDSIIGFEDMGSGRKSNKIANHALVFMAQGCRRKWKQPLAYYFSHGGVSAEQLQVLLLEVLDAMQEANLHVVATVCDMGSANVKMLKKMGSTVLQPFIMHNGRKIFNIFDVCHLLKCIRNLFVKYNIQLPVNLMGEEVVMEARWSDIERAYNADKDTPSPFRSMPKLKDAHIKPIMQLAMKVKLAAQVMSHTVTAFVYCLISRNLLPQRALATATLTSQVDQMFDSLNGNAKIAPEGKPLACVVSETSGHIAFWKQAFKNVQKWNIIRKPSDVNMPGKKLPSHIGWLQTLRAMPLIWQSLKNHMNYFCPRTCNQDALENLFGAIRSGCGCNENPTVSQFVSSLKTQVINGLTNQSLQGTNCEEDDGTILSNLRTFLEEVNNSGSKLENKNTHINYISRIADDIAESISVENIGSLSIAYVSGYIVKRILRDSTCNNCRLLLEGQKDLPFNQFISFKEYSHDTEALHYPSEKLVQIVGQGINILEDNLPILCIKSDLEILMASIFTEELDFSWISCKDHYDFLKSCIIHGICRIGLPWYCTRYVRNLKEEKRAQTKKLKKLQHR